jgi:aerobic-type carbon monoxide dehydrogenase small subunit (CoxS/CutS family)
MQVTMTVNGESVTADVEPRMLLVHFLRDELRLTGTHWGATPPTAEPASWPWTASR